MREVDVVYLYEHAARELDVACAVSTLLERDHGATVEIVQWPVKFGRMVHKIRPRKLVILPFCYSGSDFSPLFSYWRKVNYINLTWEQLFYPGNRKAKTPRGEFAINSVYHHAWSEYYAQSLRRIGVPEHHIFLNGQPAYTLYDQPYSTYFGTREDLANQFSLDPAKKWLFFPENYNWAFYLEDRLELWIQNGQSAQEIEVMREFCRNSLSRVLHWFMELVRDDPGFEVILRPRPSTTMDEFVRAVKEELVEMPKQMHVIQEGTVREWILASQIVFSSHSTSLIEASIAQKQAYMLEPFPVPGELHVNWHDFLPHIQSFDDFASVCKSPTVKSEESQLAYWARSSLMRNGDSINNLAIYLAGFLNSPVAVDPSAATAGISVFPPALVWSIYRNLRRLFFYWRTGGVEPVFVKDVNANGEVADRKRMWRLVLDGAKTDR